MNEIFDPDRVDHVYSQDPRIRAHGIKLDRTTNYGVVGLDLLEEIYSDIYSYRIQYQDKGDWPQEILTYRTVTGMTDIQHNGEHAVRLHVQNDSGAYHTHSASTNETLDVDLVVVASGYSRDAHGEMLNGLKQLMPNVNDLDDRWKVRRDYSIQFKEGAVQSSAGIWLQGCNESTHGLSDTLLSILATRGGEMVQSIFGSFLH